MVQAQHRSYCLTSGNAGAYPQKSGLKRILDILFIVPIGETVIQRDRILRFHVFHGNPFSLHIGIVGNVEPVNVVVGVRILCIDNFIAFGDVEACGTVSVENNFVSFVENAVGRTLYLESDFYQIFRHSCTDLVRHGPASLRIGEHAQGEGIESCNIDAGGLEGGGRDFIHAVLGHGEAIPLAAH